MKKKLKVNWYDILITDEPISKNDVIKEVGFLWSDLIKAAVDLWNNKIAIGGELHADEEEVLLQEWANQSDIWWINLYLEKNKKDWIEFDSMINLRPRDNNFSRGVDDVKLQEKIKDLVYKLIKDE